MFGNAGGGVGSTLVASFASSNVVGAKRVVHDGSWAKGSDPPVARSQWVQREALPLHNLFVSTFAAGLDWLLPDTRYGSTFHMDGVGEAASPGFRPEVVRH